LFLVRSDYEILRNSWYRQHPARPCKKRKDGAPQVFEGDGRDEKSGPRDGSQNPHPFDFAQGRLSFCKGREKKNGTRPFLGLCGARGTRGFPEMTRLSVNETCTVRMSRGLHKIIPQRIVPGLPGRGMERARGTGTAVGVPGKSLRNLGLRWRAENTGCLWKRLWN
jgi:hypothetical protein